MNAGVTASCRDFLAAAAVASSAEAVVGTALVAGPASVTTFLKALCLVFGEAVLLLVEVVVVEVGSDAVPVLGLLAVEVEEEEAAAASAAVSVMSSSL